MQTSPEALALAKSECLRERARHGLKMRRKAQIALKEAHQVARVLAERFQHEKKALAIRVGIYKSPYDIRGRCMSAGEKHGSARQKGLR